MVTDAKLRQHLNILHDCNDAELDFLYKNVYFTVYPSLYEGWGLPIDESLRHGKFCLASNTSSMPEVGGDLLEYLDPADEDAWVQRLEYYINNANEVFAKEANILAKYKLYTWHDAGEKLYAETELLAG
jgi:hypothetical protein